MNHPIVNSLFYLFAIVSIAMAISVVTTRKILRAAIYLMMVLVMSAGFYILLDAEFLAGVQILVYVGGIVVLLVFAVMLTRTVGLLEELPSAGRKAFALLASGGFFATTVTLFAMTEFAAKTQEARQASDAAIIGKKLLDYGPSGYALPFELISLLLLAAVIGGIVLARKSPSEATEKAERTVGFASAASTCCKEET